MSEILIGLVGDVVVNRESPLEPFREVLDVLRAPDIVYGNVGCAYSDRPQPPPGVLLGVGAPAHNRNAYAEAGFDVVSMATNHSLDFGQEAMLETRAHLRAQGVHTCGAGSCDDDARDPALIEVNGIRVAFLGYASVFPMGYEATARGPGIAAMRAYNFWRDRYPNHYLPGREPVACTVPDESDLAQLTRDIRRAKKRAEIVVTCFHWGDFSRPFHITDHEIRTAKHCIDVGADMIVGHHHHALRGVEWYGGKPILYGLGHFVLDARYEIPVEVQRAFEARGGEELSYEIGPRKGWPLLPLHKDTRMTIIAWARGGRDGFTDIGVLPCRLTADGLVHPLPVTSKEGREVIDYLETCNRTQGFKSRLTDTDSIALAGFKTVRVIPV